jgi:tRNA threonylcarbamoyladenosine biosynthesis protein TsaE
VTSLVVPDRGAMHDFGERVSALLRPGDLVVLSGGLGAGKTTLTQGIGRGLRVRGAITSPTFVIARVHPATAGGPALVHVDAYRLSSLDEVDDLDLDASLDDAVTVVEWGEGKVEGLAESRLEIHLQRPTGAVGPDAAGEVEEPRTVTVQGVGPRWVGVDLGALLESAVAS